VGFFEKLFGGKKTRRKPRQFPPEPTPEGGARAPDSFPFDGEVRVYHADYKRLTTGWWKVTVASLDEWQTKIDDMQKSLRQHFGQFQTQDGRLVPRWSTKTWEVVRRRLRVGRR
jgi:hypothetical protein